jgi:hypothetical protein
MHVETNFTSFVHFLKILVETFARLSNDLLIFFRSDDDPETENPIAFNAQKRKQLGDAIQESFLHPKPFKIEKMSLPTSTKRSEIKKEEKKTLSKNSNIPKHRFNVI